MTWLRLVAGFLLVLLLGPAAAGATAMESAERLLGLARQKRLTDPLAEQAAQLVGHDDPFVAAIAEWAIAIKVGIENSGQQIAWPRPDPPQWFKAWASLKPEFLLDADYARFAILWGIHNDGSKLLSSVGSILKRAEGAAREAGPSPAIAKQLDAIRAIQAKLAERLKAAPDDLTDHRKLWLEARRAARPIVLANPAVDFDRLVFVKRHPAHSHRNITGSQYPWCHKPGGDICVQTGLQPGAPVRGVLNGQLGPGHVRGLDLWWDADRVVFGYARQPKWPPRLDALSGDNVFLLRKEQEPTHIFEARLDGTGLRQVTNHAVWSDFEPTWCASGDIAFASDRSGRSSECGKFSADHTVINLYAVAPDGSGLRRLSDNKDIDRYPHSLDNGLIAYTRWDYQERHFFEIHSVWTVRPDGTMSDALFKQHLPAPFGLRDTRSVPGGSKLIAIATGHHTFAYGPVVVVDPQKGINTPGAIQAITPGVRPEEGPAAGAPPPEGGVPDRGGLYQTPWALSEKCFLASYSYAPTPSGTAGGDNPNGFAIYLMDACGNKELLHRDLLLSCSFPIPLRKRPRPPVLAGAEAQQPHATCYVTNVYDGAGLVPGSVKHLRILQRVGWPLDTQIGAMRWIPGNAYARQYGFWSWAPVRVIGTVPVETDGSACFRLPADAAVYFQALDDKYMELRRMRSHVTFQPGEVRGCRGCHESQAAAPAAARAPLALLREPDTPTPPPWGSARLLGYEWLVQPILDRHCVRCHDSKDPKGVVLTSTRAADGFLQSFHTIFPDTTGKDKKAMPLVAVSNRFSGAGISQAREFGSHKSRLIRVLLDDALHTKEVKLGEAEWLSLVTWVDANAPYYDRFFNRRPPDGGPPRRDIVLECPPPFPSVALPPRP
ncbi:MAG TPA: hypothetical protein VNE39_29090 [Planctomycetota bacterium]|nr:hypothetical protein [Planctomycetota bacterium]